MADRFAFFLTSGSLTVPSSQASISVTSILQKLSSFPQRLRELSSWRYRVGLTTICSIGRTIGTNRCARRCQVEPVDGSRGRSITLKRGSPEQIDELKSTGKVSGFTDHDINNVESNPAWAGDPRNIVFLSNGPSGGDHLNSLQGHRGNYQNATSGRLIDRQGMINQASKKETRCPM
jgi:hypothetical protein